MTGWTGKLAALNKNVIVSSSRAYAHGGIRVWVSYPLVGMTYFFHIKYIVQQWKYICHYITWSENSRKFISPHDQKNWTGHCRVAIRTVIITIYYIIRYISLEIIYSTNCITFHTFITCGSYLSASIWVRNLSTQLKYLDTCRNSEMIIRNHTKLVCTIYDAKTAINS